MATQKILEELNTKETPEPKDPGLIRMEDVVPYTTAGQKQEYLHKYQVCGLCVASNQTFASNKTFIAWTLINSDKRSAVSGSWNPGTSAFIQEGVVSTWY